MRFAPLLLLVLAAGCASTPAAEQPGAARVEVEDGEGTLSVALIAVPFYSYYPLYYPAAYGRTANGWPARLK